MIVKNANRPLTVTEFNRRHSSEGHELIDGYPEAKEMGNEASWIQGELGFHIRTFVNRHRLGWVFDAEGSYACFPGRPNHVRKPDVSFVRFGRFENERLPEGSSPIPPDLVVEVVSPQERAERLAAKIAEFETVGVPLIWVVYPHRRLVQVRAAGTIRELGANDELTGDPVLPEFRVRVADLFPLPPAPATGESA